MKESVKKFGFTLVELLVVISIIALLLSILMPSLNKVRNMGRQVVCLSNTKQMNLALMVYAQDNRNYGINYTNNDIATKPIHWMYNLRSYLGSANTELSKWWPTPLNRKSINDSKNRAYPTIRVCPSNNLKSPPYYTWASWQACYSDYIRFSYEGGDGSSLDRAYQLGFNSGNTLTQIKRPSDLVTFREGYEGHVPNYSSWPGGIVQQSVIAARHSGGENFAFADGHSKWYADTSITARIQNSEIFKIVGGPGNYSYAHFHINPK